MHRLLTCEQHPELRWMAKEEAINDAGRYTGARNIFFLGLKSDGHFPTVSECPCPSSLLIVTADVTPSYDPDDPDERRG